MSIQITTSHYRGYRDAILTIHQQKQNRLLRVCRVETAQGERHAFDYVGTVEASDLTQRHGDTEYINTPHNRRWTSCTPARVADLIDKQDKLRAVADPSSAYMQTFVAALRRKAEKRIIDAATGTAVTGKDADGTAALPASQTIAVDYDDEGGTGDVGLTVGKLRRANEILMASEILGEDDNMPKYLITNARGIHDLLESTEVGSVDFAAVKNLQNGTVTSFMGFEFIRTEQLNLSSGDRMNLAIAQGAMGYAAHEELFTGMDQLPQKEYSVQIYARNDVGSVRIWDDGVVSILCNE